MSKLYGTLRGARGAVTRAGHSRMTTHVGGWNAGIEVELDLTPDQGLVARVFKTGGSSHASGRELLETYQLES